MKSSYTNAKRKRFKRGKASKLQKLSKRALNLGAIGLLCAAIYTIVSDIRNEDRVIVETEIPIKNLSALSSPQPFLAAYLSAYCDIDLLEGLQTVRVAGTIESTQGQEAFVLMKKRPDLMRFTVDQGSDTVTIGVDGDYVWKRIRASAREDLLMQISGPEADQWLSQSRFFDRIISAHYGIGRILSVEAAKWKGRDCLKVQTEGLQGEQVTILVDPKDMRPIAEHKLLPDGRIKASIMSDYRRIDGIPFAFNIETQVAGAFESRVVLQSVKLNTGVLSGFFEAPQGLR